MTLERGEQILLFLNRRGFASFPICASCGQALRCNHCDISLTLHQKANAYRCHYCGFTRASSSSCTLCGSARIKHLGLGTEKVEACIQEVSASRDLPGKLFVGFADPRAESIQQLIRIDQKASITMLQNLLKLKKRLQDPPYEIEYLMNTLSHQRNSVFHTYCYRCHSTFTPPAHKLNYPAHRAGHLISSGNNPIA